MSPQELEMAMAASRAKNAKRNAIASAAAGQQSRAASSKQAQPKTTLRVDLEQSACAARQEIDRFFKMYQYAGSYHCGPGSGSVMGLGGFQDHAFFVGGPGDQGGMHVNATSGEATQSGDWLGGYNADAGNEQDRYMMDAIVNWVENGDAPPRMHAVDAPRPAGMVEDQTADEPEGA